MSSSLKDEILKDFFGKILKENKLFALNFSQKFLEILSLNL